VRFGRQQPVYSVARSVH